MAGGGPKTLVSSSAGLVHDLGLPGNLYLLFLLASLMFLHPQPSPVTNIAKVGTWWGRGAGIQSLRGFSHKHEGLGSEPWRSHGKVGMHLYLSTVEEPLNMVWGLFGSVFLEEVSIGLS